MRTSRWRLAALRSRAGSRARSRLPLAESVDLVDARENRIDSLACGRQDGAGGHAVPSKSVAISASYAYLVRVGVLHGRKRRAKSPTGSGSQRPRAPHWLASGHYPCGAPQGEREGDR